MKLLFGFVAVFFLFGCVSSSVDVRLLKLPLDVNKSFPGTDFFPPLMHSSEWFSPVPLSSVINTNGVEDSPFFFSNTLYFFFTPDARVPPERQLLDGVTGIYSSVFNGSWSVPVRVVLSEPGKLSLDGCAFTDGKVFWFCSAREGFSGINIFSASLFGSGWGSVSLWVNNFSDFGEFHFFGDSVFFHSSRAGGFGGLDLWYSTFNGSWGEPVNLAVLNSVSDEGWPFVSVDGSELWFSRAVNGSPAIFRSKKVGGEWLSPELIVSQFAGEPTLDGDGNLYFVHHFFRDKVMLESDIYFAEKK